MNPEQKTILLKFLFHHPMAYNFTDMATLFSKDEQGKYTYNLEMHYTKAWTNLERIYQTTNKTRSIGISNFNVYQVQKVLESCSVKPAVNQCEIHPYSQGL